MYTLARTTTEINDLLGSVAKRIEDLETYADLTYEDGIRDGILWIVGQSDEYPIDD